LNPAFFEGQTCNHIYSGTDLDYFFTGDTLVANFYLGTHLQPTFIWGTDLQLFFPGTDLDYRIFPKTLSVDFIEKICYRKDKINNLCEE